MRRLGLPLIALVGALAAPGVLAPPYAALAQSTAPKKPPVRSDAPSPKPEEDEKNQPVTVDADQMENMQKEGLVIFTGNVVARQNNSVQYADRTEVYLDQKGDRIVRTVSLGNVRIITKDCRVGTARRAEYYDAEQRVVLIGNARVWKEDNMVTGERITIFLAEDRSVAESSGQGRVKAIFYPKSQNGQKTDRPAVSGPFPCR